MTIEEALTNGREEEEVNEVKLRLQRTRAVTNRFQSSSRAHSRFNVTIRDKSDHGKCEQEQHEQLDDGHAHLGHGSRSAS